MQSPQESFSPYLGIFPPYLLCNLDRGTNGLRGSFHTGGSMTQCCVMMRLLDGFDDDLRSIVSHIVN